MDARDLPAEPRRGQNLLDLADIDAPASLNPHQEVKRHG
jgi:hypothetical protein